MTADRYKIFNDFIEGVQIISPDYEYLYVNKTVAMQAKTTVENLTGATMMERFPGIENTEVFHLITLCLNDGKEHQLINEFDFPDGSKGYFELRVQKVPEGALVLSIDITEIKRAEELIKKSKEDLEKEVQLRIKEIHTQKEIIESQLEELKHLNQVKDKFFSIVAHDLKSPLNSLKAFSQLLINHIEKLDVNNIKTYGQDILNSVDNALNLTNNLISWAKIQMKKHDPQLEQMDMSQIIENVLSIYKEIASKKCIQVNWKGTPQSYIHGDPNQIEFVIRNLINNAIKYTKAQGLIQILLQRTETGFIQISIKDKS